MLIVKIPSTYQKLLSGFERSQIVPTKYNMLNIDVINDASVKFDLPEIIKKIIDTKEFHQTLYHYMLAKEKVKTEQVTRGHNYYELYNIEPNQDEVVAIICTLLLYKKIAVNVLKHTLDINNNVYLNIKWMLDYKNSKNEALHDYLKLINLNEADFKQLASPGGFVKPYAGVNVDVDKVKSTGSNDNVTQKEKVDSYSQNSPNNLAVSREQHTSSNIPAKPSLGASEPREDKYTKEYMEAVVKDNVAVKKSSDNLDDFNQNNKTKKHNIKSNNNNKGDIMHKDTENKNSDSQYSTQPLGQVLVNGDAAGYSDKNIETKNHQVLIDFLNANIAHGLLPNDNSWLAVAGFKLGRSEIIPAVSYGKYRILMNTKDDGRQLLKVLDNQNGGAELSGPEAIVGLKLLANLVTEFQRQQTGRVS